jgi:hypothetical protein
MREDGQRHTPAALSPGKTWYPLYRRLAGPQVWTVVKKVNIYLSSLMMKVPDHIYVLG